MFHRETGEISVRRRLLSTAALTAVLAAGVAIAPVPAIAQELQWDADGTAPVNGGSGVWNTTNTNWYNGTTYQTWSGFDFGIFGGTAGTVEIDGMQGVWELNFDVNGYLLVDDNATAGQIIAAPLFIQVTNAGDTATINAPIEGDGLLKDGRGTLVLGGSNDVDFVQLFGGTLSVGSLANLGDPDWIYFTGGTLNTTGSFSTAANGLIINGTTAAFDTDAGTTLTLTGTISQVGGAGSLTKTGGGTLELTGTNTYSGGTNINDGTLQVTSDANLGNAAGGLSFDGGTLKTSSSFTTARATTLNAGGGTFDVDSTTILTHNGIISGAGSLTKTGGGELELAGANTYTGPTNINQGVVETSSMSALGINSAVTVSDPATLQLSANLEIGSLAGDGTVQTGSIFLTTGGDNTSTEFSGTINGTGGVTKTGTGVFTLSGANSFAGNVNVQSGVLAVEGGAAIADGTSVVISQPGTLRVIAEPETVLVVVNAGTIDMQDGVADDLLTANSNYLSNGGSLLIDAQLNTAGGTADRLVVNGDVSNSGGATQISVNDVGNGSGSADPLTVVSVTGTTNDGDFVLGNDVFSGPLQYSLLRQDKDWNLIASLLDQSLVAPTLQSIIAGDTGELIGKLEDRRSAACGGGREAVADLENPYSSASKWCMWARIGGNQMDADGTLIDTVVNESVSYDSSLGFIQGGVAINMYNDGASKLIASVFGHYAKSSASIADEIGSTVGSMDNTSAGVAASLTWLVSNGFYADLVGYASWHDIDTATSDGASGSTDGDTLAGSLEMGYRFYVSDSVRIVPQAQVIYQNTSIDSYTDSRGVAMAFSDADHVEGRFGVALEQVSHMYIADGILKTSASIDVVHDFTDDGGAILNDTPLGFEAEGTELVLGGGFQVLPYSNGIRFGGQADYRIALDDEGREGFSLEATVGVDF